MHTTYSVNPPVVHPPLLSVPCYWSAVTAILLLQNRYRNAVTAMLYCNAVTAVLLLQYCYCNADSSPCTIKTASLAQHVQTKLAQARMVFLHRCMVWSQKGVLQADVMCCGVKMDS